MKNAIIQPAKIAVKPNTESPRKTARPSAPPSCGEKAVAAPSSAAPAAAVASAVAWRREEGAVIRLARRSGGPGHVDDHDRAEADQQPDDDRDRHDELLARAGFAGRRLGPA